MEVVVGIIKWLSGKRGIDVKHLSVSTRRTAYRVEPTIQSTKQGCVPAWLRNYGRGWDLCLARLRIRAALLVFLGPS